MSSTKKVTSILRLKKANEGFRISVDGASKPVEILFAKMGLSKSLTSGPRYLVQASKTLAVDVDRKTIEKFRSDLISLTTTHEVKLSRREFMLPLRYASKDDLQSFLRNPISVTFVATNRISDGMLMCLDNAILLAKSSDKLEATEPIHAPFLTFSSLEELGKASILGDALSPKPGNEFMRIPGFRKHTDKMLRAIEGLAGRIVEVTKNNFERRDGALKLLHEAAKTKAGHQGAITFRLKYYRKLVPLLERFRDLGELFRSSSIYVEYHGNEMQWRKPWTRFSALEINLLNETIREYSEEYGRDVKTGNILPLEQVVPTSWFAKLAKT